jgi:hypothetical protein
MLGLLLLAVLFFLLTPGVLLTLPNKGSKYTVAATHAVVFVLVAYLLKRNFRSWENMEDMEEGFQAKAKKMDKADTKAIRNAAAQQM